MVLTIKYRCGIRGVRPTGFHVQLNGVCGYLTYEKVISMEWSKDDADVKTITCRNLVCHKADSTHVTETDLETILVTGIWAADSLKFHYDGHVEILEASMSHDNKSVPLISQPVTMKSVGVPDGICNWAASKVQGFEKCCGDTEAEFLEGLQASMRDLGYEVIDMEECPDDTNGTQMTVENIANKIRFTIRIEG